MNLAIVVGVSKYKNLLQLPPCEADAKMMADIIAATEKYAENTLVIIGECTAVDAKSQIREFIKTKKEPIDEIFFYFSGHGNCDDKLYFCFSDFEVGKPNITGLSNDEIDELFRGLNPQLVVKILDACNSGTLYIKDVRAQYEKSLSNSGATFKHFICMASSKVTQSSFADADGSRFTKKYFEAIAAFPEGQNILYRDIQAYISDSFREDAKQTPIFVSQATAQEIFSCATKKLISLCHKIDAQESEEKKSAPDGATVIREAIKRNQLDYVDIQEVEKAFESAKRDLEKYHISTNFVDEYYQFNAKFSENLDGLPKGSEIATYADKNQWQKRYYIQILYKEMRTKVPKDTYSSLLRFQREFGDDDYVVKTVSLPNRINLIHMLPWAMVDVKFEPKTKGLLPFGLTIGVIHSRTDLLLLSSIFKYTPVNWDTYDPDSSFEWKQQSFQLREIVTNPSILFTEPINKLETMVSSYLVELTKSK